MDDLQAEMWEVSAAMASQAGLWVDRAIDLSVQMLVDGDDRDGVVAVAALGHGASQADAIDLVTTLLTSNGIRVVAPTDSAADRFALLMEAFAHGGVSVDQFEGAWYVQLPAYDAQSDQQRIVTQLLDDRDHESDPTKREAIGDALR